MSAIQDLSLCFSYRDADKVLLFVSAAAVDLIEYGVNCRALVSSWEVLEAANVEEEILFLV